MKYEESVSGIKTQGLKDDFWKGLISLSLFFLFLSQAPPAEAVEFQYLYDGLNRLSRVIDSEGNVLTYSYDAVGNILSIKNESAADHAPVITGITPTSVNQGEAVEITLTGTGLLGGRLSATNPGLSVASGTSVNDTKLTAFMTVARDAPLGPATLTLTTPIGSASTEIMVKGLPAIRVISPVEGSAVGGTVVTLSGNNFIPGTTVSIGGFPAVDVVVVSDKEIRAGTPAGTSDAVVDVVVNNGNGSATLTAGYKYLFPFKIPVIMGLETGSVGGLQVTLTEAARAIMKATLLSGSPAIATLPDALNFSVGQNSGEVPLRALSQGMVLIAVTLEGSTDSTRLFVEDQLIDTDGDGLPDVAEIFLGTNPNNPDSDNDGLSDNDEVNLHRTNPLNSDTDGDGVSDRVEVKRGSDPNDPASFPVTGPLFSQTQASVLLPSDPGAEPPVSTFSQTQASVLLPSISE